MKYFLLIDTSADAGVVAISGDGALVCLHSNSEARNHAAAINLMINDAMDEAGIGFADLAAVVVCAGPGSYTGLRIGMATAKGVCYALGIPLLAHNKLTLLAWQAYAANRGKYSSYVSVLFAREKEYFLSEFDQNFDNIFPASHVDSEKLDEILADKHKKYVICQKIPTEVIGKYTEIAYVHENASLDFNAWAIYAWQEYICNKTVNLSTAEPFYLKQVYTHK